MMSCRRKYDSYPSLRTVNNEKDRLFNSLSSLFKEQKWGFTNEQIEKTGKLVLGKLTDCLWYLDPFWDRLNTRGINAPDCLKPLIGYRRLKQQKKKIPKITDVELKDNIESIAEILMLPWIENPAASELKKILDQLVTDLRKYHAFLAGMNKRTKEAHQSPEPVRNFHDSWTLRTVLKCKTDCINEKYSALDNALKECSDYQPIDLINFEPNDKEDRRKWLSKMEFSSSVNIFTYSHGNNIGNTTVVWKVPEPNSKSVPSDNVRIVNLIRDDISQYCTRRMRKDFFERYQKVSIAPVVLRDMYRYLTNFECGADETSIDDRFVKFLLEAEDCELIYDLRKDNGRPCDPKYNPFWEALQKLLDENSTVHERRQTSTQYLPFAISVDELREQVQAQLPPGTPVPSCSWIRLNFQPQNLFQESAGNYTGKFNIKYAVQQRLLRVQHVDSGYCRQQFRHIKSFAVQWRDFCLFQCLDDKAIVPVGDPGHPVSTGVRSHHGAIVANNNNVVALDHDFHVAGIVPSVCLQVDIPKLPQDSFYRGNVHVTVKDKVFQSSSPLRHSTETVNIVRQFCSEDGIEADMPILVRYTDGGPDHRTNYKSVHMSTLCEFISLIWI